MKYIIQFEYYGTWIRSLIGYPKFYNKIEADEILYQENLQNRIYRAIPW